MNLENITLIKRYERGLAKAFVKGIEKTSVCGWLTQICHL